MSDPDIKKVGDIADTYTSRVATAGEMTKELSRMASVVKGSSRTAGSFGSAMVSGGNIGFGSFSALPSVLAQNSPLSVFQYTLSRADRLALYRYFARSDPFVGRAIELHAELPMSRITIGPPKGPSHKQNQEINRIYENLSERLGLLQFLLEVAREYWTVGDVYIWHEWDDEIREWGDIYCLPTEYCHSVLHPFRRNKELVFFARPLVDTASVRRMTDRDLYLVADDPDFEKIYEELEEEVPDELKEALDYGEGTLLNTDPLKGSYCYHISRNRSPNEQYGTPVIERCLETLFRLENLKNAQIQISSRNMNPKYVIYAENIAPDQLDDLRTQVDLSLLEDADYPIVANYPIDWNTIGANERLLAVEGEYGTLREDLATGLGTTKELLTGAASYGGQRITLEMMNTQYLTFRELMREYVEQGIFRPIAESKGHFFFEEIDTWLEIEPSEIDAGDEIMQQHDGTLRKKVVQVNKVYNHSSLRFNRLSIRDNTEVYDQLFMLHQKGSLAVRYLLDLHNIDPEENETALIEDLATVKDPMFNRLLENLYGAASENILTGTNIVEKIIQGLNLDVQSQANQEPQPASAFGGMAGSDLGMDMVGGGGAMGDLGLGEMGGEMVGGEPGAEMGPEPGGGAEITPGMGDNVMPMGAKLKPRKDAAPKVPGEMLSPELVNRMAEWKEQTPMPEDETQRRIAGFKKLAELQTEEEPLEDMSE